MRRACARACDVLAVTYGGAKAGASWAQCAATQARCGNLGMIEVSAQASQALGALARRAMRLHGSAQDEHVMRGADDGQVTFEPVVRRAKG